MSFAEGFYNLHLEVSAYERNIDARFKFKTTLHPDESTADIAARLLIFSLNYDEQLKNSAGSFEPELPSAYEKNYTNDFVKAFFWRMPTLRLIKRFWFHDLKALSVYCDENESFNEIFKLSIPEITRIAKGAKFCRLEHSFLQQLGQTLHPSSNVNINLIEGNLYCTVDDKALVGQIKSFDLLELYQMTLNNSHDSLASDLN
jgi:uncharacterized protein YaeQ